MTTFVIVVLVLAVIGLACLAFFWRGLLEGQSRFMNPYRIMREMQQVHAAALGATAPQELPAAPPEKTIIVNGREWPLAEARPSSLLRRRRQARRQQQPISLIHGDYR